MRYQKSTASSPVERLLPGLKTTKFFSERTYLGWIVGCNYELEIVQQDPQLRGKAQSLQAVISEIYTDKAK